MLFERVIDKEIYDKVFAGCMKEIVGKQGFREEFARAYENGQESIEMKVRDISKDLMKKLYLAEDDEAMTERLEDIEAKEL